jgi:CheY-like chemotaxis protein
MKKKLNCVMLIDDDEPTNFLSQMIVTRSGCTEKIKVANSGAIALDYLSADDGNTDGNEKSSPRPDLIFLDINMPAMNGWEFLDRYNELSRDRQGNVIIIMLTTSLNPDDQKKSRGIPHISGFANKPLTPDKLQEILRMYFPANF